MSVCNLWWRCLIMYDLGCMLVESKSFEISSDYRVYMGSSPLAWLPPWLLIHLNSYKLDGSVTHLHVHSYMLLLQWKYASKYIHSFPYPDPPKNILLLIRERIAKNISVFPYKINAQVILVTTTCYIDECSKKKKKKYEEIKRGKCPEPRKKRKKTKKGMYPLKKIQSISFSPKISKEKERYVPPQKSKSRIRFLPLSPSSPYTIHSPHMHILIWLIDLFLWIHGLTMQ